MVIQSHLKKLFAGIHSVEFDEEQGRILAMKSLEGEVVQLKKPVPISNDVEVGACLYASMYGCNVIEREMREREREGRLTDFLRKGMVATLNSIDSLL